MHRYTDTYVQRSFHLKGTVHSKNENYIFGLPLKEIEGNQSYSHTKHRLGVICKKTITLSICIYSFMHNYILPHMYDNRDNNIYYYLYLYDVPFTLNFLFLVTLYEKNSKILSVCVDDFCGIPSAEPEVYV